MSEWQPGDSDFESFYGLYRPMIVSWLSQRCASSQDAEDLAEECFLYCLKHWDDYRPEKASRKTWLYLIVRSRWKNYLRDRKTAAAPDDLDALLPDQDLMNRVVWLNSLRDELAEILEQLPQKQRDAVVLRFFLQWKDREIARSLGTSAVNVRVLIHRALRSMERRYADRLKKML